MQKYFGIKTKTGRVASIEYAVTRTITEATLTLTRQEYRLVQMIAESTDFPQDWIDQDTGIAWSLFDCVNDDEGNIVAIYRTEEYDH